MKTTITVDRHLYGMDHGLTPDQAADWAAAKWLTIERRADAADITLTDEGGNRMTTTAKEERVKKIMDGLGAYVEVNGIPMWRH